MKRLVSIAGDFHLVTFSGEVVREGFLQGNFIIHNQYFFGHASSVTGM